MAWIDRTLFKPDNAEGSSTQLPRALPSLFHWPSPLSLGRIGYVVDLDGVVGMDNTFEFPITNQVRQILHGRCSWRCRVSHRTLGGRAMLGTKFGVLHVSTLCGRFSSPYLWLRVARSWA